MLRIMRCYTSFRIRARFAIKYGEATHQWWESACAQAHLWLGYPMLRIRYQPHRSELKMIHCIIFFTLIPSRVRFPHEKKQQHGTNAILLFLVEMVGIEPTSESRLPRLSTGVVDVLEVPFSTPNNRITIGQASC